MAAKENLSHICSTRCSCTGQVDTKITSMCYFNVKINIILFLISNATWTSRHVGAVSYKAWMVSEKLHTLFSWIALCNQLL